jgi:hypothetical protein
VTVDINEFISTIFEGITSDERACLTIMSREGAMISYPASPKRLARYREGEAAVYFCISSVAPPTETGYLGRRHQDLKSFYCLVLDDIGTKATTPPVAPSWILESSEGNFQYGYLLNPIELNPESTSYIEGSIRALANEGYSDPGAQGCYRVMRLPGSLHKTGFVSRITEWHPSRFWDLPDLMDAMSVKPLKQRVKRVTAAVAGEHQALENVTDHIYLWLEANNKVLDSDDEKVFIQCPWVSSHTGGVQGPKSAVYWPANYGSSRSAGFKCLHGHCADRKLNDLLTWVGHQKLNGGLFVNHRKEK